MARICHNWSPGAPFGRPCAEGKRRKGENLGQLSSKGVSKELAGEFCTSHRASGKASLYSNRPDAQVKSRASVSEDRGHQILEGGQQVWLWVTAKFIS